MSRCNGQTRTIVGFSFFQRASVFPPILTSAWAKSGSHVCIFSNRSYLCITHTTIDIICEDQLNNDNKGIEGGPVLCEKIV